MSNGSVLSKTSSPSWQSTLIALALIALVGGVFIVVFEKEGTGEALKVWGALGTLVGVLVGAVPTYFFGQAATNAAQASSDAAQSAAADEKKAREEAAEREREASAKSALVLGLAAPSTVQQAKSIRPDLFQ